MLGNIVEWFGSASCAWLQFAYAIWQLVRNNEIVCVLLAAPPAYMYKLWRPELCVIIDEKDPRSREYESPWTSDWLANPPIINKQIPRLGLTVVDQKGEFVQIEAEHGTYLAFTGDLLRLEFMASRMEPVGLHFATPIAGTALAYNLPKKKLLDKMLLKDHGFFVSRQALLMFTFNDTFNTGVLTFLATIPLMLQGRGYQTYSGFASVLICILDFARTPLYRLYDRVMAELIRVIKLHVFGKNRALYDVFGTLSSRWKYCNNYKGHAYYEKDFVTTRRVFVAWPNRIVSWSVVKETRDNIGTRFFLDPEERLFKF